MTRFSHVLVAGGAGFIGSHIVDRLLENDITVTVLDNFDTGRRENLRQWKSDRRLNVIRGNVRDRGIVRRAMANVDAIFNEAAVVSVSRSIENPSLTNEVNVGGEP